MRKHISVGTGSDKINAGEIFYKLYFILLFATFCVKKPS
jgi:hypothetical protein